MNREIHVRICESVEVRFLCATRLHCVKLISIGTVLIPTFLEMKGRLGLYWLPIKFKQNQYVRNILCGASPKFFSPRLSPNLIHDIRNGCYGGVIGQAILRMALFFSIPDVTPDNFFVIFAKNRAIVWRNPMSYGAHLNAPLFAHLKGTFHSQGVLVMQ